MKTIQDLKIEFNKARAILKRSQQNEMKMELNSPIIQLGNAKVSLHVEWIKQKIEYHEELI